MGWTRQTSTRPAKPKAQPMGGLSAGRSKMTGANNSKTRMAARPALGAGLPPFEGLQGEKASCDEKDRLKNQ